MHQRLAAKAILLFALTLPIAAGAISNSPAASDDNSLVQAEGAATAAHGEKTKEEKKKAEDEKSPAVKAFEEMVARQMKENADSIKAANESIAKRNAAMTEPGGGHSYGNADDPRSLDQIRQSFADKSPAGNESGGHSYDNPTDSRSLDQIRQDFADRPSLDKMKAITGSSSDPLEAMKGSGYGHDPANAYNPDPVNNLRTVEGSELTKTGRTVDGMPEYRAADGRLGPMNPQGLWFPPGTTDGMSPSQIANMANDLNTSGENIHAQYNAAAAATRPSGGGNPTRPSSPSPRGNPFAGPSMMYASRSAVIDPSPAAHPEPAGNHAQSGQIVNLSRCTIVNRSVMNCF